MSFTFKQPSNFSASGNMDFRKRMSTKNGRKVIARLSSQRPRSSHRLILSCRSAICM